MALFGVPCFGVRNYNHQVGHLNDFGVLSPGDCVGFLGPQGLLGCPYRGLGLLGCSGPSGPSADAKVLQHELEASKSVKSQHATDKHAVAGGRNLKGDPVTWLHVVDPTCACATFDVFCARIRSNVSRVFGLKIRLTPASAPWGRHHPSVHGRARHPEVPRHTLGNPWQPKPCDCKT